LLALPAGALAALPAGRVADAELQKVGNRI